MAVYIAQRNFVQVPAGITWLTLSPTTLGIKILKVEFDAGSTNTSNIYRSTGTVTGGTAFTPSPLRNGTGAPSPTATAKYNVTSVSGTPVYFVNNAANAASPFQPVASLIVPVGDVFVVKASAAGNSVAIHYDELEIQPGY